MQERFHNIRESVRFLVSDCDNYPLTAEQRNNFKNACSNIEQALNELQKEARYVRDKIGSLAASTLNTSTFGDYYKGGKP